MFFYHFYKACVCGGERDGVGGEGAMVASLGNKKK